MGMGSRGLGWAKGGDGTAYEMPSWAGRTAGSATYSHPLFAII